jgi:nucleoside-diphosphate-sugar epimerase
VARYLITGSHGFLGSHLVARLEALGHTVLRGDRDGNIPEEVDVLIDTASYGNLRGQDDELEIYKANVERVEKLLKSNKYNAAVVTSTSSVHLEVQTPYSESKKMMEEMAKQYGAVIIRPYTIYGNGDYEGHLIPRLFASALHKEALDLSLSPVHDYIHVDDLVEQYLKPDGYLVEGGTGKPTSNAEVALLIQHITGKKLHIRKLIDPLEYDSYDWYCRKPLSNTIILEDGLRKIYDYEQES